jgi:hypothetical protein
MRSFRYEFARPMSMNRASTPREPTMPQRLPIPASPALEAVAQGARFRDRIAVVKAPPEAIFKALAAGGAFAATGCCWVPS